MIIFPAIDIIGGNVVRLTEGDYDRVKSYTLSPMQAAEKFYNDGARYMHVVDLDGAKSGKADNAQTIEEVVKSFGLFVEVGGGIRTEEQIQKYLDYGVRRVILGTAAVTDQKFLERAVKKFGDKISVGVDAKNGFVAVDGWRKVTDIDAFGFCRRLADCGVGHVIFTDISRDGALKGTNFDVYEVLCQIEKLKITASGGITFLEEIKKLKEMKIYGAILGKALYENKLELKRAIALAENG